MDNEATLENGMTSAEARKMRNYLSLLESANKLRNLRESGLRAIEESPDSKVTFLARRLVDMRLRGALKELSDFHLDQNLIEGPEFAQFLENRDDERREIHGELFKLAQVGFEDNPSISSFSEWVMAASRIVVLSPAGGEEMSSVVMEPLHAFDRNAELLIPQLEQAKEKSPADANRAATAWVFLLEVGVQICQRLSLETEVAKFARYFAGFVSGDLGFTINRK